MKVKITDGEKNKKLKDPFDAAGEILGRRAYSSCDLSKKLLEKGYSKEDVAECISKLIDYGYLNDAEYAIRACQILIERGKGNQYIKQKLKQSGIASELLPELGDEFERAMKHAEKMDGKTPEQIGRRLAGLGFAPATVYKVLGKIR